MSCAILTSMRLWLWTLDRVGLWVIWWMLVALSVRIVTGRSGRLKRPHIQNWFQYRDAELGYRREGR
jgi:hypothetical protein